MYHIVLQTLEDAMTEDSEKKKRVIHTRVPESLDKELKEKASTLGVSVSNLVRNVLLNAFGLVEGIVVDSARIAESTKKEAASDGDAVIGWQELVLNLNAVCLECNEILAKGSTAAIAVTQGVGTRPVICMKCLEELQK
jgi:hypothetical protein